MCIAQVFREHSRLRVVCGREFEPIDIWIMEVNRGKDAMIDRTLCGDIVPLEFPLPRIERVVARESHGEMQIESLSGFMEFLGIVARVVRNIEKRDVVRFLIIVAAEIKK